MKRTPEQARSFFNVRHTESRGDGRELYKTPVPLVGAIVDSILLHRPELSERTWIDPCAGDGRWGDVIRDRGVKCIDFDLHPLRDGIVEQDFTTATFDDGNLFFVGNPPFSMVGKFVERSLLFTDSCYFLGGGRMIANTLGSKVSLLHRFEGFEGNQRDGRSKAWFHDTNGKDVIIWCCGAIFDGNAHSPFHISREMDGNSFAVGVHCFCEEDERVVAITKGEIGK